jgi:SAM-dependent methyltransferase
MSDELTGESSAAERWAAALGEWAIPQHVLDQAPGSPWRHDPATFAVDDTLDRTVQSAEVARSVLPPNGGVVLDVGCGGGRASMSLVPPAERVIGVDENPEMLVEFTAAAAAAGARSSTIEGRWPDVAAETPVADVVVCHHVAYNVADIEPFLFALTDHARLAVVVVLPPRHPQSAWNVAWRHYWGIDRPDSPTANDLVAVLAEIGIEADRWEMPRPPVSRHAADPDAIARRAQRTLCLGDDCHEELIAFVAEHPPAWPTSHVLLRWPGSAAT